LSCPQRFPGLRGVSTQPDREGIDKFSVDVPSALYGHEGRTWSASPVVTLADNSLTTAFKSQFLQVLVMLRQVELNADIEFSVDDIKTQKVLALGASDIDAHWASATDAILAAWRFLQIRCGVKDEGSLRNKLLILPIAMALRGTTVSKAVFDKVEYWYWSSVLTDTYTARQNENSVTDTNLLLGWIEGGPNPFTSRGSRVLRDEGYSHKETLLRQVDDERVGTDVGLYLVQLTLALGGQDILLNRRLNADTDELQDHHLIPLGTATSVGQSSRDIRKGKDKLSELLNSPLNRAYQSASTNQEIGAKTIAQYMKDLPDSVKSSLYLPADNDDYLQKQGQTYEDYVRALLAERFDGLKAAIVNHLTGLVS
jgi:hypothetical protein